MALVVGVVFLGGLVAERPMPALQNEHMTAWDL